MRNWIIVSTVIFTNLAYGASGSPLKTGVEAEQNRIDMQQIKEGMGENEVIRLLGYPFKRERHKIDHQFYEVWFYVTKAVLLGQSKLTDENFTPLVFQNSHLLGWGKLYYKHLLDIDKAKEQEKEDERQAYTNDADEWPQKGTHIILTPPSKESTQEKKAPIPQEKTPPKQETKPVPKSP